MKALVPTIGLEIHAELVTKTKMFCSSKNEPCETPNTHVCPVCMGHPGTLPVINKEAIRQVLRVGVALGGTCADYTEFDRKNYFYPDLPKGYQISQFAYPLISGGTLKNVKIRRIHLEEDTARSQHDDVTGETLVDYNRAGVPLMELVTEPDMHSAEEASVFAKELQLILRYLGASRADMEMGEMRVEANVSVAEEGKRSTGYVEIKNLNSFKAMERAVAYEIKRQEKIVADGGEIAKQTLGWDEAKQATFPQRSKEEASDYRYFPDPDLPSLRLSRLSNFDAVTILSSLPELPDARRVRYKNLGIRAEDVEQYVTQTSLGDFFDEIIALAQGDERTIQLASNYVANDLVPLIRDHIERDTENKGFFPISASSIYQLVKLLTQKKITTRNAKDILPHLLNNDRDVTTIAESLGFLNAHIDLGAIARKVLEASPSVVADYKSGKEKALQFLIGQCMRETRGSSDPAHITAVLVSEIAKM